MGVPNVITFFGNRQGMSDAEAIANCVDGAQPVKAAAEQPASPSAWNCSTAR